MKKHFLKFYFVLIAMFVLGVSGTAFLVEKNKPLVVMPSINNEASQEIEETNTERTVPKIQNMNDEYAPKYAVNSITDQNFTHNVVFFTFSGDAYGTTFSDKTYNGEDLMTVVERTYNTGNTSVKKYFETISNGILSVTTDLITNNYAFVSCDNPITYYQPKYSYDSNGNITGTISENGYEESERITREMQLLNELMGKTKNYFGLGLDVNNDNYLDATSFIYVSNSTYSPGWSDLLWPHQWQYYPSEGGTAVSIGGDVLGGYTLMSLARILPPVYTMRDSNNQVIGDSSTASHELMHVVGFPDLYEYESNSPYNGVGVWDVMAATSNWAPQYPLSYLRYKAGWLSDNNVKVISTSGRYSLKPVSYEETSGELLGDRNVCYVINNPNYPNQYIYLEYRARIGEFDGKYTSISGTKIDTQGLIIYRVDEGVGEAAGYGDGITLGNYHAAPHNVYVFRKISGGLAYSTSNSFNTLTTAALNGTAGRSGYGSNLKSGALSYSSTGNSITYQVYDSSKGQSALTDSNVNYINSGIIVSNVSIQNGEVLFNIDLQEPYPSHTSVKSNKTEISFTFTSDDILIDQSKIELRSAENMIIPCTVTYTNNILKIVKQDGSEIESETKAIILPGAFKSNNWGYMNGQIQKNINYSPVPNSLEGIVDTNLYNKLLELAGRSQGDQLTTTDFEEFTTLDLKNLNISSLQGIELLSLPALEKLFLSKNSIIDLNPLKDNPTLTSETSALRTLVLATNRIQNVSPLQYLKTITHLDLSNNNISDIQHLKQDRLPNLVKCNLNINNMILVDTNAFAKESNTIYMVGVQGLMNRQSFINGISFYYYPLNMENYTLVINERNQNNLVEGLNTLTGNQYFGVDLNVELTPGNTNNDIEGSFSNTISNTKVTMLQTDYSIRENLQYPVNHGIIFSNGLTADDFNITMETISASNNTNFHTLLLIPGTYNLNITVSPKQYGYGQMIEFSKNVEVISNRTILNNATDIPDTNLYKALQDLVNKPYEEKLLYYDVYDLGITSLNLNSKSISSLKGLSLLNLTNINYIDLSKNAFIDINTTDANEIKNIASIQSINFAENRIEQLSGLNAAFEPTSSSINICLFYNYLDLSNNNFSYLSSTGNPDHKTIYYVGVQNIKENDYTLSISKGENSEQVKSIYYNNANMPTALLRLWVNSLSKDLIIEDKTLIINSFGEARINFNPGNSLFSGYTSSKNIGFESFNVIVPVYSDIEVKDKNTTESVVFTAKNILVDGYGQNSDNLVEASVNEQNIDTSVLGNGYYVDYAIVVNNIDIYLSDAYPKLVSEVNVIDRTAPIITLLGNETIYLTQYNEYYELGYNVLDNYYNFDNQSIASPLNQVDVEIVSNLDINKVGTYTISYTAIDQSNNMSQTINRTVIVEYLDFAKNANITVDYEKTLIFSGETTFTAKVTRTELNDPNPVFYWYVNGELVGTSTTTNPGELLLNSSFTYLPKNIGNYVVTVKVNNKQCQSEFTFNVLIDQQLKIILIISISCAIATIIGVTGIIVVKRTIKKKKYRRFEANIEKDEL